MPVKNPARTCKVMRVRDRWLMILSVVLTCAVVALAGAKKEKSIESLQRDRKNTQAQIEKTTNQLAGTRNEANRQLQRLDDLQREISTQEGIIAAAREKSDSVKHAIQATDSRIDTMALQLRRLKEDYRNTLRRLQLNTSPVNNLVFVMSAKNANEGLSRVRYLQAYARWRRKKANAITAVRSDLDLQQQQLKALHAEQTHQVERLNLANRQLQTNREDTHRLVDSLGQRQSELMKALNDQKKRLQALQNSIDTRIAQQIEQQRKLEAEKKRKAEKQRREEQKRKEKERKERERKEKAEAKGKPGQKPAQPSKATPETKPTKRPTTKPAEKPDEGMAAPDRKIQGGFEANKGNLLFPVSGRYAVVRKFGRNPHPTLPGIMVENSGIDISVGAGTKARSVYGGTVSGIFKQDGYGTVVMVRHGSYITIYAGLADIAVRNGQEVTTGQTIGTIGSQGGNEYILHFELRNERTKLNPMQWIK